MCKTHDNKTQNFVWNEEERLSRRSRDLRFFSTPSKLLTRVLSNEAIDSGSRRETGQKFNRFLSARNMLISSVRARCSGTGVLRLSSCVCHRAFRIHFPMLNHIESSRTPLTQTRQAFAWGRTPGIPAIRQESLHVALQNENPPSSLDKFPLSRMRHLSCGSHHRIPK